jgi:hypothetical protein
MARSAVLAVAISGASAGLVMFFGIGATGHRRSPAHRRRRDGT